MASGFLIYEHPGVDCQTDMEDEQDDNVPANKLPDPPRQPHAVAPIQVLSNSLTELFTRPGMVPAVEAWKSIPSDSNNYRNMQDGDIWRNLKGADGESFFFGPSASKELRLGVTFSLDW